MSQADKARRFKALHIPGTPLVLYNIWDAGSAKTVASAGAQALAFRESGHPIHGRASRQ